MEHLLRLIMSLIFSPPLPTSLVKRLGARVRGRARLGFALRDTHAHVMHAETVVRKEVRAMEKVGVRIRVRVRQRLHPRVRVRVRQRVRSADLVRVRVKGQGEDAVGLG